MAQKLIDEKGNRYGSLTVVELTKDKNGRTAWLCQCDCGNTKIVRGSDLRKGKITHCSAKCPCKVSAVFIDETGNRYGSLTVMYKTPFKSSSNKTLWHCKCDCGRETDVIGEELRTGHTKSCGCKAEEYNAINHSKNLKGQIFGYLEPIEIIEKSSDGNIWRCKCHCGCNREDIFVSAHRLCSGNTASCGKLRRSHGELEIEKYLKKYNISFKQEYSFENLISANSNKKLRFDFAIFKHNILVALIEYDGQQHFQPTEYFGGEEGYKKLKTNDKLKNTYCQQNNIPLLRIKYDENIEEKLNNFLKEIFR